MEYGIDPLTAKESVRAAASAGEDGGWEHFSHMADTGIRARGESIEKAFCIKG